MYSIFSIPKSKPRNYFAMHKNFYKVVGISLSKNESKLFWIYATIFLFITTFTYPFIQWSEAFKFYDNLEIMSIVFSYGSVTLLGTGKACVLLYNRESIRKNLDALEQGVFALNLEEDSFEVLLIKNCIQLVNRQSLIFMGGVYTTVLIGIIDAILKRIKYSDYKEWAFPVGYFSLFDVTYSPNFEIICFYQTFCIVGCFGVAAVTDTLIAGVLAHIATQLKILQHRIKMMIENAHKKMLQNTTEDYNNVFENNIDPSNIPWIYLRETVKDIVINHLAIINLAEQFENIFNYLVLVQFLSTSATMCFVLYCFSLYSVTDIKFIEFLVAIVDVALQVLLYCYWGNEVFLQSWAIADACNEVNYVGTDVRFQKGLQLIILRSQRPITLTAGKFTTLSLTTFVWIMRASYTYYMAIIS